LDFGWGASVAYLTLADYLIACALPAFRDSPPDVLSRASSVLGISVFL
jgi:hypothetical protein